MAAVKINGFIQGVGAGAAVALVSSVLLVYLLDRNDIFLMTLGNAPDVQSWVDWTYVNLGSSIPVFAVVFVLFFYHVRQLRRRLESGSPVNEVAQTDHLTDTWTSLFFGVGVIWTAIGMRSALLYALGDPETTVQAGAFAVLQRMVDGGILLALSTTIFGGIGGYLMRVFKTVSVGSELQQYYDETAREESARIQTVLESIDTNLQSLATGRTEEGNA